MRNRTLGETNAILKKKTKQATPSKHQIQTWTRQ